MNTRSETRRRSPLRLCLLLALALASLAGAADPGPLDYHVADPKAPAVTPKNLLASERFWPYRVSLTSSWQPPGREAPLAAGEAGILIRIELQTGLARIDFGGHGVHETPIDRTDLIQQANRIRQGELGKLAPNFVTAVGPRLVDSAADPAVGVRPESLLGAPGFLCVFADPDADGFYELASVLAPLRGRHGVETVLLPQGSLSDPKIWERLRALDWKIPFVYRRLAAGYTDSLLPPKTPMPTLLLQTREGRVLFQSRWSPGIEQSLRARLDESFGAASSAR